MRKLYNNILDFDKNDVFNMQGPNFSLEKILQTNVIDENIKKTYEVDDTIFVKTVKN